MKKIVFVVFLVAMAISSFAQQDPKAKEILDKVSSKVKNYQSLSVKFVYATENQQNKKKDSVQGAIRIKGERYRLNLLGNEIYFDGKALTTLMVEANEANITKPGSDDESLNPLKILTLYQKGFKYKFIEDAKEKGKTFNIIDIYPAESIKNKKYHRIRIKIDAANEQIVSFRKFDKDGMIHTVTVKEFKPNTPLEDKIFIFNKADYPGVEVVDMRE
jgi:outer membrane lipoprotein-sorting protein